MSERIGELLVRENLISLADLKHAQGTQRESGENLTYTLTKLGMVGEKDLTKFMSAHYGVPAINLDEFEIDESVIKLIPRQLAQKHQILPINRAGSVLIVAMSDPSNLTAIDDVKFNTGYNVETVVASDEALRSAIERYYDQSVKYEQILDDIIDEDVDVERAHVADFARHHQAVKVPEVLRARRVHTGVGERSGPLHNILPGRLVIPGEVDHHPLHHVR